DMSRALTDVREEVAIQAAAALGHFDDGELVSSASAVHSGIGALDDADELLGDVDESERAALREAVEDVRAQLDVLSAELIGVTAELTSPLESALPGETVTIP